MFKTKSIILKLILVVAVFGLVRTNALAGNSVSTDTWREDIKRLRREIDNTDTLNVKIEKEHELAYAWLDYGGSRGRFKQEAARILKTYTKASKHYYYLDVQITYGQLLSLEQGEKILMGVINLSPEQFQYSEDQNPVEAFNRIKQSAIWAYLNGRIAKVQAAKPDVLNPIIRKEAEKLAKTLEETREGRRCIPLVTWWKDAGVADKPGSTSYPELKRPNIPKPKKKPVSSTLKDTKDTSVSLADKEEEIPDSPPRKPKSTMPSTQRDYDSVITLGTVKVPENTESEPDDNNIWVWILGVAGIVLVAAGLLWKTPASTSS